MYKIIHWLNQENLRKNVFKSIKMLGSCIIKKDTFKSKTNFYVLCIKHFCEIKKRGIKARVTTDGLTEK